MYLCLDVGNTQIHGGLSNGNNLELDFRINTKIGWSGDQLGIFFLDFCRQHNIAKESITQIGICSVVPSIDHELVHAARKYFAIEPFFIKTGVKTGLIIKYNNPAEIGADLVCGAVAASHAFNDKNLIICDLGTASTVIAVSKKKEFLGGIIVPGIATQVAALSNSAEKLFSVQVRKPPVIIGKTTTECIQSGIFHGHLGALSYLVKKAIAENFSNEPTVVLGTGGIAPLFEHENLFDIIIPDLVHKGIVICMEKNLGIDN